MHTKTSPNGGSYRIRPAHVRFAFVAATTTAALALASCSSDNAPAPARDTTGSTVVAPTEPNPTPATDSIGTPSAGRADSLIIFQNGGRIKTALPDGSAIVTVAPGAPSKQEHPDWSRDGLHIVFETEFSKLWTVNADGSELIARYECVSPCQNLQDGAWSPDGTEIAFMVAESQDGTTTSRSAIVAFNVATGDVRTVYEDTSGLAWLFQPRWSADGTSIVFEADFSATSLLTDTEITSMAIGVVPTEGATTPKYLFTVSGPFEGPGGPAPDWSPVDDLIVFSRGDNLFTIHPDGTGEQQLTDFDAVEEHALQPTFAPEGDAIVFTYVTGQFGIDDAPTAALIGLDGRGQSPIGGGARMTHPRLQP